MKTLTLTYNDKDPQTKRMVDDLLANGEIRTLEVAKDPFTCSEPDFYSDDFEEKWAKGIPLEEARQRLLKRVRSWGLPSRESL